MKYLGLFSGEFYDDKSKAEEQSIVVRCNTERKAIIFATEKFKKKYPNVGDMVSIIKVEVM